MTVNAQTEEAVTVEDQVALGIRKNQTVAGIDYKVLKASHQPVLGVEATGEVDVGMESPTMTNSLGN